MVQYTCPLKNLSFNCSKTALFDAFLKKSNEQTSKSMNAFHVFFAICGGGNENPLLFQVQSHGRGLCRALRRMRRDDASLSHIGFFDKL